MVRIDKQTQMNFDPRCKSCLGPKIQKHDVITFSPNYVQCVWPNLPQTQYFQYLEVWNCKTDTNEGEEICDLYTPKRKRCKKCRYLRCIAIGMKSQLVLLDEKARKKHTHPKKNKISNYRSKQYTEYRRRNKFTRPTSEVL